MTYILVRWQRRDLGPRPHARYILTEKGGLHIDYGLDDVSDSETTHVSLLDSTFHSQTWNEFQRTTALYQLTDEVIVEGMLDI